MLSFRDYPCLSLKKKKVLALYLWKETDVCQNFWYAVYQKLMNITDLFISVYWSAFVFSWWMWNAWGENFLCFRIIINRTRVTQHRFVSGDKKYLVSLAKKWGSHFFFYYFIFSREIHYITILKPDSTGNYDIWFLPLKIPQYNSSLHGGGRNINWALSVCWVLKMQWWIRPELGFEFEFYYYLIKEPYICVPVFSFEKLR